MSQRSYHKRMTQGVRHVDYALKILPQGGTTPPIIGQGDPNQTFVTVQRGTSGVTGLTGTTGTYVITTLDPFVNLVTKLGSLTLAGQRGGQWTFEFGQALQNVNTNVGSTGVSSVNGAGANAINESWSIPITVFSAGTATDLSLGDSIDLLLVFNNSSYNP